jgi:protein ImuB
VGLTAQVALATSRAVARVVVQSTPASVVIIRPGCERAALALAPVAVLDLPEPVSRALGEWGVRTLGELAALPRAGLGERLGAAGLRAYDLALGRDPDPFRPWVPPPFWEEAQELDWEIHELPALLTVVRAVLERLTGRLTAAHVAADVLDVGLALADGTRHERTIAVAYPTRDPALMQALVRSELEAHPPAAPVTGVIVSVHPVVTRPGQAGLWQPPMPAHRDLTGVLARLVALVGDGNIGSPRLLDSHRPDAVTLAPFSPPPEMREDTGPPGAQLVLRRLRPPRPVEIVTGGERPARVHWNGAALGVVACAGPWRASGEWWDTRAWARDEWDLLLHDGTLCRVARDGITGAWTVDALYD